MGCDYYICKVLSIFYEEKDECSYDSIELSRDRGYFYDSDSDSDVEDRRTFGEKYNHYLKSNFKPLVVYTLEGGWKNDFIKSKYNDLVNKHKNYKGNPYKNKTITKIIKEE